MWPRSVRQDRRLLKQGRVRPSVSPDFGVQSHDVWSCHIEEPANVLRQADGKDRKIGSLRAALGNLGTASFPDFLIYKLTISYMV